MLPKKKASCCSWLKLTRARRLLVLGCVVVTLLNPLVVLAQDRPVENSGSVSDLPFVEDITTDHILSENVVGKGDLSQKGIVWHQTDTGPIDSLGRIIDGKVLVILERDKAIREGIKIPPRPGYNVLCGFLVVVVDNEIYSKCEILVPENAFAWHAGPLHNTTNLAVSYVDTRKRGSPTPAQLRSMYAITAYWMAKYDIQANMVRGHRELKGALRSDPVGVDMAEVRKNLKTFAIENLLSFPVVNAVTFSNLIGTLNSFVAPEDVNRKIPTIDWSPQIRSLKQALLALQFLIPLCLIIVIGILAWTYDWIGRISSKKRWVAKPTFLAGIVGVELVAVIYLSAAIVHTPLIPQEQQFSSGLGLSNLISLNNRNLTNPTDLNNPDWETIAEKAFYKSPDLLRLFVERSVPRGSDGYPLPAEAGGKIFPPFLAAAFPHVETNTARWDNPDPRKEGPWGRYKGWDEAPKYFPRTIEETLKGKKLSRMAQACRDGLVALAENPAVQALYPGLKPQEIRTARGCEVGRGQILAIHFRPEGMFGNLENMDVWNNDQLMVELIYIHLVSKASPNCGGKSWFETENDEVAMCGYNPRQWSIESRRWYWDGIRGKREELEEAWNEVVGLETVSKPSDFSSPVVGSSMYAIWDTIPSFALRMVRLLPENTTVNWVEEQLVWFGTAVYSSQNAELLGFTSNQ